MAARGEFARVIKALAPYGDTASPLICAILTELGYALCQVHDGNLTILGDWFVADSMVPKPGGYRQTVFNWHTPTVSKWVKRFDDQFESLCREQKINPAHKWRRP